MPTHVSVQSSLYHLDIQLDPSVEGNTSVGDLLQQDEASVATSKVGSAHKSG
jgi:hypothetical protein